MNLSVSKYNSELKDEWDGFVGACKNTHFIFYRDYVDYHSDRFSDFSIIVRNERNEIVAVLPSNISENVIYSHQGLTFGGYLTNHKMNADMMLSVFYEVNFFLKNIGVNKIVYKCIPHIYHESPAEEDRYALFINNATIVRRDVSSSIYLGNKLKYSKGRKWAINKAKKEGVEVELLRDHEEFWPLLENVLMKAHGARPVHNIQEINMLRERFPGNIKTYVAKRKGIVISGAVIFETETVAHAQYLATSEDGRNFGGLDYLIDFLISSRYQDKRYFDFGTSNEDQGRTLNKGLIAQKEGFGARAIVHDFYEIEIK